MPFDAQTADIVATVGASAGVLGLGLGLAANARLSKLRRSYAVLAGTAESGDVIEAVNRHLTDVRGLRADVEGLRGDTVTLRDDLADAIRHVAVVRYDAFGDMGGRLSFSAALLDDAGDGLVLTSINGRSETRTYAKGVKAGQSEHQLSPEELQVVEFAVQATGGRRTRRGRG